MRIAIASDSSGYALKAGVKDYLIARGHEVMDVGQQNETEPVTYVDAASNLAKTIAEGKAERGFVFCGTGGGVSLVVNKHKGCYCVPCESMFTAQGSRIFNNANVLAMGCNVVGIGNACAMADRWLEFGFCQSLGKDDADFVSDMLTKLKDIEAKNFK